MARRSWGPCARRPTCRGGRCSPPSLPRSRARSRARARAPSGWRRWVGGWVGASWGVGGGREPRQMERRRRASAARGGAPAAAVAAPPPAAARAQVSRSAPLPPRPSAHPSSHTTTHLTLSPHYRVHRVAAAKQAANPHTGAHLSSSSSLLVVERDTPKRDRAPLSPPAPASPPPVGGRRARLIDPSNDSRAHATMVSKTRGPPPMATSS
jgi:hypothetical protein